MLHIKFRFLLFLSLFLAFSCVKDENGDFTQIDNLAFNQQITGSLITLNATLSDFDELENLPFNGFDLNNTIDVFNNIIIQNELKKLTLHFDFENTFDRNFEVIFNFKDSNNVIVFTTAIIVNNKAITSQDVLVEGMDKDQIKRANSVDINISVLNSTPANTIDNTVGAFVSFNLGASLELNSGQQIDAALISLNTSLPDFAELNNIPFTHFELNTPLDIFNVTEIQNELKKVNFTFEIENTFNRDFEITFEFLDDNDLVTYRIPIFLDKISKIVHEESVELSDLENLKRSKKVKVSIDVINANTMDNTLGAFINFKSSATFFF